MISVKFECDHPKCYHRETPSPPMEPVPIGKSIDVYPGDWDNNTPISMFLPEGWIFRAIGSAYAQVWCPNHEDNQ